MAQKKPIQLILDFSCTSNKNIEQTISKLLLEYIQLVLYQRSQIPEPLQLIQRNMKRKEMLKHGNEADSLNKKRSDENRNEVNYLKKCKNFLLIINQLQSYLDEISRLRDDVEVLVAIGSTTISTKEAFSIKLKRLGSWVDDDASLDQSHSLQIRARKFCLEMVQSIMHIEGFPIPTNTRIFVKTNVNMTNSGFNLWKKFRYPLKKLLLETTLNFTMEPLSPSSDLNDSFVQSTRCLDIFHDNEPTLPDEDLSKPRTFTAIEVVTLVTSAESPKFETSNLRQSIVEEQSKHCDKPDNHNITRNDEDVQKSFSTGDVLNAVLNGSDVIRHDCNHVAMTSNDVSADNYVWYEVPLVIRGFKI